MITEIGITSGEILVLLEKEKRPMSIHEIYLSMAKPKEVIDMSIGGLTREGITKVTFKENRYIVTKIVKDKHNSKTEVQDG